MIAPGQFLKIGSSIKWRFVHLYIPNGDIIYFSSDFYPGMGGKDLYYSKLSEQAQWRYPVNLGFPINSKGDESSFIVFPMENMLALPATRIIW